jgi:hypothetical protein
MTEWPTAEQLAKLRSAGWTIVRGMDELRAVRDDDDPLAGGIGFHAIRHPISWRAALDQVEAAE